MAPVTWQGGPVSEIVDRFREAARACEGDVFWTPRQTPAEAMAAAAKATEELGIDQWDVYAERGAVARLEQEVAELLGKPAAAMFPSGIMAQQAALRVWCDRAGSLRVGIPELSHLLQYEDDGPRLLHGFRFEHLSTGRDLPTVADLERLVTGKRAGLAAVLLELPLRDAGCLLPAWDDLAALTDKARDLGVAVHVDGARIWESQPFYDRPLDAIAALADSVYVSFYKGLGGLAGACLAADEDVVDEARRWRKRMGGTLFHLTPYAVLALAGLREHLPRMAEYVGWGRALAEWLVAAGVRVNPDPPQTNTFELFAEGEADAINERAIAFMERTRVQPCGVWRPAPVPGLAMCEVAVHAAALPRDPKEVGTWLTEIIGH
jgi:threonine aldolase